MTAISSNATPPHNGWSARFEILGKTGAEQQTASVNLVNPEYFGLLRIPLVEGRMWTDTENHNGAHVAVISRTLAQRYFPNGDAIGHSVKMPEFLDRPPAILSVPNLADSWLPVVGIVADVRNDGLANPVEPAVYVPYTLTMWLGTQILVRSEAAADSAARGADRLTAVNPVSRPAIGS